MLSRVSEVRTDIFELSRWIEFARGQEQARLKKCAEKILSEWRKDFLVEECSVAKAIRQIIKMLGTEF
jgi:hypothetical protein